MYFKAQEVRGRFQMTMKKEIFFLLLIVFILSPFLAFGQESRTGMEIRRTADRAGPSSVLTAESLRDAKIVDPQGQELGTVKGVKLDLKKETIAYLVMEPGTKDRLIPVPYSAFLLTPGGDLVLDIDQGRVFTAPSYPKGGQPNWSDPAWVERIHEFWASGSTWQPAGGRVESVPFR